ncbi:nucleotide exchange factor GrpE [Methanobrevibacter olleyae]|uniref:Protein GrpE n=1 Tax=Methanobrevibacter olleyae TaxID=294671 RepID=A0A126R2Z6_METOL|nr:nucleotide exchange factor GrpE [Methanobrevibacter olleyae]AMK16035.1 molecular chaperone GrpE [Methanobrevibacter olleyae]SFL68879.1 molecular chaperone GrpE [Methanobrevibacter olleyae]
MAKKNIKKKSEDLDIDEKDQSKVQEDEKEETPSESEEESSGEEDECEDDELAKLNKDLEKKDEKIIELKSHIQRLQADFDNFRKQGDKQKQDLIRYANEGLITKFLDVYEDMGRALENSTNEEEIREGLKLIYSKMKNTLEKEGLKEIPTVGEKFDPFRHEALLTVDSPDYENNEIVDELMKGYTLKDKVIKYSKVRVCKKAKKE